MAKRSSGPKAPNSVLNKLFNGTKYKNVAAAWLETNLGLEVRGGQSFTVNGKTNPTRFVCLPIVEGATALLSQQVSKAVLLPSSPIIWCEMSPDAYQGVACAPPQSDPVVVGIDAADLKLFNSIVSSSGSGGKTDLSVYPLALLDAAAARRQNNMGGVPLLEKHLALIEELETINELPITGASGVSQAIKAGAAPSAKINLETLFREVADEAYEYLTYGMTTNGLSSLPQRRCWTNEAITSVVPPGWKPGMNDMTTLFVSVPDLKGFINDGLWPRPAAPPPPPPPPPAPASTTPKPATKKTKKPASTGSPASTNQALEPHIRLLRATALMRAGEGGPLSFLLQGPPGGGKTYSVENAGDNIPTASVVWNDAPVGPLVAELNRDLSGAWAPTLGLLGSVVRLSMLAATRTAIKRGGSVEKAIGRHRSTRSAALLEQLAAAPDDKDVLDEIDRHALPFYPVEWLPINDAYFESGAPEVGAVFRFVMDEVFGLSKNKQAEQLLKALLANRRPLVLPGAGWCTMYALNVHFVGVGNSSMMDKLNAAVVSRFGAVHSLPHPAATEEKRRMQLARQKAAAAAKGQSLVTAPVSLRLVDHDYEPPAARIEVNVPPVVDDAIVKLAQWSRDEYEKGSLREPIDPRGTEQLAIMVGSLMADGMTAKDAFTLTARSIIAKIARVDPAWGLPSPNDQTEIDKQINNLSAAI